MGDKILVNVAFSSSDRNLYTVSWEVEGYCYCYTELQLEYIKPLFSKRQLKRLSNTENKSVINFFIPWSLLYAVMYERISNFYSYLNILDTEKYYAIYRTMNNRAVDMKVVYNSKEEADSAVDRVKENYTFFSGFMKGSDIISESKRSNMLGSLMTLVYYSAAESKKLIEEWQKEFNKTDWIKDAVEESGLKVSNYL